MRRRPGSADRKYERKEARRTEALRAEKRKTNGLEEKDVRSLAQQRVSY